MSLEWPDFEAEMKKKLKAKKKGSAFIVSDDDDDMKDTTYRSKKRKDKGLNLFKIGIPIVHTPFCQPDCSSK